MMIYYNNKNNYASKWIIFTEGKFRYNEGVACEHLPAGLIIKMHKAPGVSCMRYPEADTFVERSDLR